MPTYILYICYRNIWPFAFGGGLHIGIQISIHIQISIAVPNAWMCDSNLNSWIRWSVYLPPLNLPIRLNGHG